MAEENNESIQTQLTLLRAQVADLEVSSGGVAPDLWGGGISPDLTEGGTFSWALVDLGYSISGTVWTARAGKFYPGARGEVAIAVRTLDFATLGGGGGALANGTYHIYLQTTGETAAEWATPPTTAVPLTDGQSYREWRFKAVWADPSLTIDPTGIGVFNLQLPGTHG